MIKYIILISSLILLSWCWSTSKETKTQNISFGSFNVTIDKNYEITNIKPNKYIKNTDVLLEYKLKNYDNLSPSLVIYKYKWEYPKNIDKFFNIILDKFQKNIAWSNIINSELSDANNSKLSYFTYSISNNLFSEENKTDYFWLQAYIFGENKKIYIISYIWKNKDQLGNIVDAIKNFKTNK